MGEQAVEANGDAEAGHDVADREDAELRDTDPPVPEQRIGQDEPQQR